MQAPLPTYLNLKAQEAEILFRRIGITFAVYGEGGDPERLIPFDILPRVLDRDEWSILERGLIQRVRALNMFLWDAYHGKEIIRAGKIPEKLVTGNSLYIKEMVGFDLPQRTYTHIAGIDIVRTGPMRLLRAGRQLPHAFGRLLHDREPRSDDAAVSRSVQRHECRCQSRTIRTSFWALSPRSRRRIATAIRPSCC